MFWQSTQHPDKIAVFTGVLPNLDVELVRLEEHGFVGDTGDGGASVWMRGVNTDGEKAKRFKLRSGGEELGDDEPKPEDLTGWEKEAGGEEVPVWCHCKGVQFVLKRGDYKDKDTKDLPWFVDPGNRKLLAGFDGCDSCRLSFGVDVNNWLFADAKFIHYSAERGGGSIENMKVLREAVDKSDERVGTLAYYQSSPGVDRYFCGTCSATIFYATDSRPEILDVALGVLDAEDGARAEGFLSWGFGGIGHDQDAKGGWREGFLAKACEESEAWRVERGYPENWRIAARKQKLLQQQKGA